MAELYHTLTNTEDIRKDLLQEITPDLPIKTIVHKLKALQKPNKKTLTISKPSSLVISSDGSVYFGLYSGKIGVVHKESSLIDYFPESPESHSKTVSNLKITSDNQYLISTSLDKTVKVWKLPDLSFAFEFTNSKEYMRSSAISSDSSLLALGGQDSLVYIYNFQTQQSEHIFSDHTDWILSLEFTQNCKQLISGSRDKTIKLFNLDAKICEDSIEAHAGGVNALKLLRNGNTLVTAGGDRVIKVWNIQDRFQLIGSLEGHSSWVSSLALSNDDKFCISGSSDKTVRVWNLESMKQEVIWSEHNDWVGSVEISSDNRFVASYSRDSVLILWKFQKSPQPVIIPAHEDTVNFLVIPRNNKQIISASRDKTIKIWNRDSLECIATLKGHDNWVVCMALSKDDKLLVSGSRDKKIILWCMHTFQQLSVLNGHTDSIYCLAFSSDSSYLVSGSRDKNIRIWNLASSEVEYIIDEGQDIVNCLTLTADDNYLITGTGSNKLEIWSFSSHSLLKSLSGHTDSIYCILTTHDSRYIITGSKDKTIRLWNFAAGRQEAILTGHNEWISDLALTSDDRYLISAAWDGTIRIWSIERRVQEAVIPAGCLETTSVKLSSDNRYIISGGLDKRITIHDTLDYFMNSAFKSKDDSNNIIFYNNTYAFRRVSYLLLTEHESWMNDLKLSPFGINILHIYCYYGYADKLKAALNSGCIIIKRETGESPLKYAIERNSQKCIDVILEYIVQLYTDNDTRLHSFICAISEDIVPLVSKGSVYLAEFFEALFFQADQKDLPVTGVPLHDLPSYIFSKFYFINSQDFIYEESESLAISKADEVFLNFSSARFPYNYENGSLSSIALLKSIRESAYPEIYSIPYIQSLITLKWNSLWHLTLILTLLYWISLSMLTFLIFYGLEDLYLNISFISLSALFLIYEVLQCIALKQEYFYNIWNGIDILRGVLSIVWISLGMNSIHIGLLTWMVVMLSWLRGLTYFRAFAYTRYFVRMILETAKDSLAFMVILMYSTFGFGVLSAVASPEIENIGEAWKASYVLNHGEFSTDGYNLLQWTCFTLATLINVILMLNLLISILGDSFERFQMKALEADLIEMLDIVYEFECMMIWKRNMGCATYLQCANYTEKSETALKWQGKVKAIENSIISSNQEIKSLIFNFQGSFSYLENNLKFESAKQTTIQEDIKKENFRTMQSFEKKLESLERKLQNIETTQEDQYKTILEAIQSLRS